METPELKSPSPEIDRTRKIGELEPIELSRDSLVEQKGDLDNIVEAPLLSACQELYDKNIITLSSSANRKDLQRGVASITINADALSNDNREIALSMGHAFVADDINQIGIEIPISADSTFEDIEHAAQAITHKFKPQKYRPIGFSQEEMRAANPDDSLKDSTPEEFAKALGMVYNPKFDALFYDDERYRKAMEEEEIEE
jgi:hypothetical protein